MDLFSQLIEGNTPEIIDTTDEFITTEAVFAETIPYMKAFPRIFNLPKGNPVGKGNLCFVYGNNVDTSFQDIIHSKNAIAGNRYYFYYLAPFYRGKIYSKIYNERILEKRNNIYKNLKLHSPNLHPYRNLVIDKNESKNMFYDLGYHMSIFFKNTPKINTIKKMELFWVYFKSILNNTNYLSKYTYKFILINLNNYTFDKPVTKNLENPMMMVYYTLFRNPEILKDFKYDIFFYTDTKVLRFNPSKVELNKSFYNLFKVQMQRMVPSITIDKVTDTTEIEKDEAATNTVDIIMHAVEPQGFTGDSTQHHVYDEVSPVSIEGRIQSTVQKVRKELDEIVIKDDTDKSDIVDFIKTKTENEINSDTQLLTDIYTSVTKKNVPKRPASSARDIELKNKQKDLIVNGIKIADIEKIKATHMPIPTKDISNSIRTTNDNMKHITFQNFEKTYNEKVMTKDITNAILSLNDKSIPMYVRDIKIQDSSDELNYKDTYTISLEDANRQRHTVKVDIPKFLEDKFLYLGGNKKLIKKQNFLFPVVKTGPDTVQIVTNYNKMFIRRIDTKSVSSVERIKKLLKDSDKMKSYFIFGNTISRNVDYVTTIEYDELSRLVTKFVADPNDATKCTIFFNQQEAHQYMDENHILLPAKSLMIGIENGKPIFVNTDTQLTVKGQKSIIDVIFDHVDPTLKTTFESIRAPRRLMYTKVKVMEQFIAVIMLLGFWEGLTGVMKKMGIEYELFDSAPKQLSPEQNVLRFKDTWLVYKETVGQSLLLNGLRLIDTSLYNITDFDTIEPYMAYFMKIYGKATIGNALSNFYEFTIDPITKEILQDIDLPTDIVSLMIYAVSLLADSQFVPEVHQSLSRVRSNEIVAAILYEALAKNYINYRNSNGKKKYSIPQDIVIKNIVGLKTVEDYSTLNPTLEMEMTHSISSKGFRGANLDQSYTMEKRVYDSSMTGIISPSTSPDGSVGVNKTLTCEPSITSVRGYVDIKQNRLDELQDINLFSPGELSIPLGATVDDPTRLGHAIKQSKHVIPVKDSAPVLISNGLEEMCRFKLSSDFVVNADEDGEVVEYDDDTKIMIVRYKSGKCRGINLGEFIVKNGGGGFFLSNQLVSTLKVGDKFKKDDNLAYHKDFFTSDKFNNTRMNMGTLAKVAIMSTYNTYQDATMISQRLADAAATEMCFMTQSVIGKNSNVLFMIDKGRRVSVGDPLIQFDTSYEDNELNELLANISGEVKDKIMEEAKNTIKSKYSGVIEEIEMYSTVPLEEMSPSLRKIFSKYYNKINKKKSLLEKYDPDSKGSVVKCGILVKEPTHQIEPNKYGVIKGQNVEDSVLINFYIKHSEPLEIGSKIANFTALKNTIGEIIPEGYEPYSEYRPEETVDTIIASNSILKRMTPSVILTSLGNKCIIELKNKLKEIYEE